MALTIIAVRFGNPHCPSALLRKRGWHEDVLAKAAVPRIGPVVAGLATSDEYRSEFDAIVHAAFELGRTFERRQRRRGKK